MRTKLILVGVAALIGALGVAQLAGLPEARVTVHVLGEDGNPVTGAKVSYGFCAPFDSNTLVNIEGVSDQNGNFTGQGHSNGVVGLQITKDGYYAGWAPIPTFYTSKDNKWQPWDQTYTTILRKIIKPIPMYARKFGAIIPSALNASCGFDLEEGDWVAPYGKGKVADFVFMVTKAEYRSDNDYDASATLIFSNDGDGIQEIQLPNEYANNVFKWPREAPETGYQQKLDIERQWSNFDSIQGTKNLDSSKDHPDFFFRVRTVKSGDKIVSALYGKITSGFRTGPDKTQHGYIEFTYYLNPTPNDRNLEWDPTKNLAPTPKDRTMQVRAP